MRRDRWERAEWWAGNAIFVLAFLMFALLVAVIVISFVDYAATH